MRAKKSSVEYVESGHLQYWVSIRVRIYFSDIRPISISDFDRNRCHFSLPNHICIREWKADKDMVNVKSDLYLICLHP